MFAFLCFFLYQSISLQCAAAAAHEDIVAEGPANGGFNSVFELISGVSSPSEYNRGVSYILFDLPADRAWAGGPGLPAGARDGASRVPHRLYIFVQLLTGCSSEIAKLRPALVQLLGLLTLLFAACAYANANISAVNIDKWFSVYSFVFVWMLPNVFSIPASPFRTFLVVVFDYGGALFTFMIWKHLPLADPTITTASNSPYAVGIMICGVLHIIHLLFLGAVLVLAFCFACFRWIRDRLVPNRIAPLA